MTKQAMGSVDGHILGINSDMGEGFGLYRIGDDRALMPLIDAANVACGFHAADPMVMRRDRALAKEFGVSVGAHPSLPDLQGFGRREMTIGSEELAAAIVYQVGALKAFLDAEGMPLGHIKPHGALYAMAARDERIANAVVDGASQFEVPLYRTSQHTLHEEVYTSARDGFRRRVLRRPRVPFPIGHVIITRSHDAVDPSAPPSEPTAPQLKASCVRSMESKSRSRPQTFCIHSDTPNAPVRRGGVRQAGRDRGSR